MNTKKYYSLLLSLSFLCLGVASGRGDTPYDCTGGLILSSFAYHEPEMKNIGIMTGLDFSFSKFSGPLFWDTDLILEKGKVKYTGAAVDFGTGEKFPFSAGGNSNVLFEGHVVAGMPIGKAIDGAGSPSWSFMPYAGLGYRYLDNDIPGTVIEGNVYVPGYGRKSNYLYSPLGFQVARSFAKGWSVTAKAEYDLFWMGRQYSYMSPTITNHQTTGYGVRGSIAFRYKGKTRDFIVEPFITYWNIGGANPVILGTDDPQLIAVLTEPKNTTTEVGCKFSFSF
jgi:hypothetical protein